MNLINLLILNLLVCTIVGCSKGSDSKALSRIDLSADEKRAMELLRNDINLLPSKNYAIAEEDLALLVSEGLISETEKKSLKIVK